MCLPIVRFEPEASQLGLHAEVSWPQHHSLLINSSNHTFIHLSIHCVIHIHFFGLNCSPLPWHPSCYSFGKCQSSSRQWIHVASSSTWILPTMCSSSALLSISCVSRTFALRNTYHPAGYSSKSPLQPPSPISVLCRTISFWPHPLNRSSYSCYQPPQCHMTSAVPFRAALLDVCAPSRSVDLSRPYVVVPFSIFVNVMSAL